MKILIFKHSHTFQEIIAKVEDDVANDIIQNGIQSVSAVSVTDPLVVMVQHQEAGVGIALAPFSYVLHHDTAILDTSSMLTAFEASSELEKGYKSQTSGIAIASSLPA